MKALSLGQYLLLVAWELLIICYFGEIIYINSQRCGEALLRSPWYIHMREMRYDFLLFLLNSNRPFKLTAGKIYVLNNERFKGVSVMKWICLCVCVFSENLFILFTDNNDSFFIFNFIAKNGST